MPFMCIDCTFAGKDTPISKEQAVSTGKIFGRGLCETCATKAGEKAQEVAK